MNRTKATLFRLLISTLAIFCVIPSASTAFAEIAASHVYHNHMPNFWPYYDTSNYQSTPIGGEIRYMYDGQVINLKQNPPSGYTYFLPSGAPMPHDDLVSYYSHHAKTGAYLNWPWNVAGTLDANHPNAQMHVTMSGALLNNVNSLMYTNNVNGYNNTNWGAPWRNAYTSLLTQNNKRTMDLIHFTGHHSMGPLVGNDYMLKDLIYQSATLAQPFFLGNSFKSSKGFFPTELGFSERIIPVLAKLGIQWSVIGNNHFSRTLKDYPYLNDPGVDTKISPPNRADLQNTSNIGSWVSQQMFNEAHVVQNKYPFASTPHWVRYVDPATGQESKVVGVPVAQAESWEESYQGQVTATALKPFEGLSPQKQFFVVAHDGDNSSGRAGSEETWRNAGNVTYTDTGVKGMGIDEYLIANTPQASDVVHVQDGSWVDTRDSSSDPTWYHWKLPFGVWDTERAAFNNANPDTLTPKQNLSGQTEKFTVSFEYGHHFLERNFALLQAALNYAKTAEQIWLDDHPNNWQPTTALDNEITYPGNQLNPWMISFPVKGDPNNDYSGGANPAELGWYFLLPALDSGFGYYDENTDDNVKPTLSFNNSLFFTKPLVSASPSKDRTGPSVWWPQRYPYNPGSVNNSKAEGWTTHHFDNTFAIYTYAFDTSSISDIKVKVRTHTTQNIDASDNTYKVYNPASLQAQGISNIDPSKVSAWTDYPMTKRDMRADMNGVDWQSASKATMQKVPAQEIGDLYFSYLKDFRNQYVDYYIEATDSQGNVTKSDIQTVFVGAGKYRFDSPTGKYIEDINGTVNGTYPFVTDTPFIPDTTPPSAPTDIASPSQSKSSIALTWTASTDNVNVKGYDIYRDGAKVGSSVTNSFTDSGLTALTGYTYTIKAFDAKGNFSAFSIPFAVSTSNQGNTVTIYYKKGYATPYIHWRPEAGVWTTAPGTPIPASEIAGFNKITLDINLANRAEVTFNNGSGSWDNNNGQNYFFNAGTSTYTPGSGGPGTIASGIPVDNVAPTVPANLNATGITSHSLTLNWSASTDAFGVTAYDVYRGSALVGTTSNTSFVDEGLAPLSAYTYTVKAKDAAGNVSAASAALSVTTKSDDATAPSAPGNLTVTGTTSSSISLSWSAATDNVGVAEYAIYRGGAKVATVAAGTTSYTDAGLTASTTYAYTVTASDAAHNESAQSNAATGTTNTAPGNLVTIYYKRGFATPYIHYRPQGGSWTAVPGVPMPESEVAGYNKYTINIGSATQLEACFNNGSGTWDSKNGANYFFGVGTWTYTPTGQITSGAPSGTTDTTPPSVPANLTAPSKTATSVTLQWSASTDDIGVTAYEIYRGATLAGTTSQTTFTDTGLAAATAYSYTVKAKDAAGNASAASSPLAVTTESTTNNFVTIYYKRGFATPFIHWRPEAGTWTTAPGTAMAASEVAGYNKITLNVGSATRAEVTFNNGSGQWDSNSGQNYFFGLGTWTYTPSTTGGAGTMKSGAPGVNMVTFTVTAPSNTPFGDSLYMAGTFNGWSPADPNYRMTKNANGTYSVTLQLPEQTRIEFKITRGNWTTVEVNLNGQDIQNRTYTTVGGTEAVNLTIQKWKDI
ncbi:carbohydrate binding domain-containing protein [Cohnella suwonensis]|uniref:Carbohydrate binding domain-containing protein n=1 Tax=Cohnella suwonensis TaxID=696072 RepID=A0ABW0LVU5_9BACL